MLVGTEFSLGIFASIGGKVSRPLFKRDINTVPGNETWISTLAEKPRDQKVIKAGRGRSFESPLVEIRIVPVWRLHDHLNMGRNNKRLVMISGNRYNRRIGKSFRR